MCSLQYSNFLYFININEACQLIICITEQWTHEEVFTGVEQIFGRVTSQDTETNIEFLSLRCCANNHILLRWMTAKRKSHAVKKSSFSFNLRLNMNFGALFHQTYIANKQITTSNHALFRSARGVDLIDGSNRNARLSSRCCLSYANHATVCRSELQTGSKPAKVSKP